VTNLGIRVIRWCCVCCAVVVAGGCVPCYPPLRQTGMPFGRGSRAVWDAAALTTVSPHGVLDDELEPRDAAEAGAAEAAAASASLFAGDAAGTGESAADSKQHLRREITRLRKGHAAAQELTEFSGDDGGEGEGRRSSRSPRRGRAAFCEAQLAEAEQVVRLVSFAGGCFGLVVGGLSSLIGVWLHGGIGVAFAEVQCDYKDYAADYVNSSVWYTSTERLRCKGDEAAVGEEWTDAAVDALQIGLAFGVTLVLTLTEVFVLSEMVYEGS